MTQRAAQSADPRAPRTTAACGRRKQKVNNVAPPHFYYMRPRPYNFPHFLQPTATLNNFIRAFHTPYNRTQRRTRTRSSTIGRKHKPHRQQQGKGWRDAEKGRNKDRGRAGRNRKMGQDESRMVDEKTPAVTLESRSIEAVAKYITSGRAKSIVVMVCAATQLQSQSRT